MVQIWKFAIQVEVDHLYAMYNSRIKFDRSPKPTATLFVQNEFEKITFNSVKRSVIALLNDGVCRVQKIVIS